jgi:hypothetical protein
VATGIKNKTLSIVILSAAKNPHIANERFFAALRMTGEKSALSVK